MKEDNLASNDADKDLDDTIMSDDLDEDVVENFARQLDEIVRIQDTVNESDEESDGEEPFGYQPLSQDDDEGNQYNQLGSDDEDDEDEDGEREEIKDPLTIKIDEATKIEPETSDLIKSIMSNIRLPDEAIPGWAKNIPEQAWLPRVEKD